MLWWVHTLNLPSLILFRIPIDHWKVNVNTSILSITHLHKMEPCNICVKNITTTSSFVTCYGPCNKNFHLMCVQKSSKHMKKTVITDLSNITNLHWYCDECVKVISGGLHIALLRMINDALAVGCTSKVASFLQHVTANSNGSCHDISHAALQSTSTATITNNILANSIAAGQPNSSNELIIINESP